jgi:hypothetical protein
MGWSGNMKKCGVVPTEFASPWKRRIMLFSGSGTSVPQMAFGAYDVVFGELYPKPLCPGTRNITKLLITF